MVRPDSLHLEQLTCEPLTWEQVAPLRTKILRPHFPDGALCEFPDDHGDDTVHFGLVDEDFVAHAVATFIHNPCPGSPDVDAIQLRGMCVDEPMQRQGLGERLLESALGRLALRFPGAKIIWCNARMSAAPFYEKLGFRTEGEVFEVEPIGPHVVMHRTMPPILA